MKNALCLGRIAGIDLFIHWTFGLLLLGIPAFYLFTGSTVAEAFLGLGLLVALKAYIDNRRATRTAAVGVSSAPQAG